MARSANCLRSCTSQNPVVTFVYGWRRVLLMSPLNSWEEAKCLMCGREDSFLASAPGEDRFLLCQWSRADTLPSLSRQLCEWHALSQRGRVIGPCCFPSYLLLIMGSLLIRIQGPNRTGRYKNPSILFHFLLFYVAKYSFGRKVLFWPWPLRQRGLVPHYIYGLPFI